MTKKEFIFDATADYLTCLAEADEALEKCHIYSVNPVTAYVDISTGRIVDIEYPRANADQLDVLCVELEAQMRELKEFYNAIYALADAKRKLENVDIYEFDDDTGAV